MTLVGVIRYLVFLSWAIEIKVAPISMKILINTFFSVGLGQKSATNNKPAARYFDL